MSGKEKSLEEYEIVEDENDEKPCKIGISTERSNLSNYLDKNVQVLRQKCPSDKTNLSEELDKNDGTNTYNTSKITADISSVSLSHPSNKNIKAWNDTTFDIRFRDFKIQNFPAKEVLKLKQRAYIKYNINTNVGIYFTNVRI